MPVRKYHVLIPFICSRELGYKDGQIEKRIVSLVDGENFTPSFMKLVRDFPRAYASQSDTFWPYQNPHATLPTLQADGKVYTNTADVTSYLVKHAPIKVKTGSSLIAQIHEEQYDPNFAFLLAVSLLICPMSCWL